MTTLKVPLASRSPVKTQQSSSGKEPTPTEACPDCSGYPLRRSPLIS